MLNIFHIFCLLFAFYSEATEGDFYEIRRSLSTGSVVPYNMVTENEKKLMFRDDMAITFNHFDKTNNCIFVLDDVSVSPDVKYCSTPVDFFYGRINYFMEPKEFRIHSSTLRKKF